jgi:hypothetical protein
MLMTPMFGVRHKTATTGQAWLMLALLLSCIQAPVKTDPAEETGTPPIQDTALVSPDTVTPTNPTDTVVVEDSGKPTDTGEVEDWGWRSALYPADWTPGVGVGDTFLHDFSYAGYHNGEDPIPTPMGTVFSVLGYGADNTGASDSTAAIQGAIDAASVKGGVVYLPGGEYRVDGLLTVSASHVVVMGDGAKNTYLFFTRSEGMTDVDHLSFTGTLTEASEVLLSVDGVTQSRTVTVTDATGFAVGDDVSVGWVITDDFVDEHGMDGTWQISNGLWRPFFRRTVTAIDDHTLTLDVPLRYPAKMRDAASVRLESGYLSECGVMGLSVSTAIDWSTAWSHDRSHAIKLSGVKDCFVTGVNSYASPHSEDGYHLQSGGVLVVYAKRVTVADSTLSDAQNRGDSGNGYLFEVSRSSEVLFVDLVGRAGRHNFIQNWDFGASGIVWLRTSSKDGASVLSEDFGWLTWPANSEFHHSLAMANLIDSSATTDGWKAANRNDYSTGAGHAATQSVFWNIAGSGKLSSYQFGQGYIIGTTNVRVDTTVLGILDSAGTAPEDYTEGVGDGATLNPQSLYEDQLIRRLDRGEGLW